MSGILQIFYTFFSSVLLFFALPNEFNYFGSPVLGLFALIPLYLVYVNLRSYKQAFWLFFFHGLSTHILSSFWLAFFKDFAIITLGSSAFGTGLIEGAMGLFMYLPVSKTKNRLNLLSTRRGAVLNAVKTIWFPLIWVLYEWIKSIGFLGYPWATVSSCMYRWKILTQIADITGTYGISFITVYFTAVITEGYLIHTQIRISQKPAGIFFSWFNLTSAWCALAVCVFVYGLYNYLVPRTPEKFVNTVMVQQNADPWKQSSDDDTITLSQRITDEKILEGKEKGLDTDLVVWSEGCLKYSFPNSKSHYEYSPYGNPLIPYIRDKKIPFILGGSCSHYEGDDRKSYNSAMLFDKDGEFRGYYGKIHLVPMAEAIPFGEIPAVKSFLKKTLKMSAGWTPGSQYVYFKIQGRWSDEHQEPAVKVITLEEDKQQQDISEKERPYVTVSPPICYDDSFPDVIRPMSLNGTELFVNITDDSWSMKKSAEYQHFVVSSYRAIESRTTIARSCNSGYSVVLDPAGRVLYDMPLFKEAGLFCQIPVYKHKLTIYIRFGNWLPFVMMLICLAYGVFSFLDFRRPEVSSERKIKKSKKHKKHSKKD